MVKSVNIISRTDSNSRLDKLDLKIGNKIISLQYIYDSNGILMSINVHGASELSNAELISLINDKFIERIGLIELINTINTINTIKDIVSIDKVRGLNWYDRNPTPKNFYYNGQVSSHVATIRWGYTVPVGRMAFLEYASCEIGREVAAGATGNNVAIVIDYVPNGGAVSILLHAALELSAGSNVSGFITTRTIGQGILMFAGDSIYSASQDDDTGGTIRLFSSAKLTEFDI